MPSRVHDSTVSRTGSMPALCPATRGRLRRRAQRPLPSMMMAMCAGKRLGSIELARIQSLLPGLRTSNRSFNELDCIELNCYGTPDWRLEGPTLSGRSSVKSPLLDGNGRASLRCAAAYRDCDRNFADRRGSGNSDIELIQPTDGPWRKAGVENVGLRERGAAKCHRDGIHQGCRSSG